MATVVFQADLKIEKLSFFSIKHQSQNHTLPKKKTNKHQTSTQIKLRTINIKVWLLNPMSEGAHFTCQGHASVLAIDPPTMYWESPLGTPLGVPHA